MSNITFNEDLFSRRLMRFLLILQITAMASVLVLSSRGLGSLGLIISIITLVIFILIVLWLYARYRNLSAVREKSTLEGRIVKFQKGIQSEENNILEAAKKRDELIRAEKSDVETALRNIQEAYIEYGLTRASMKDAAIPGIGSKLKERLAERGILTAAQLNDEIPELPGFGETKRDALMSWRRSVVAALENTKPTSLRAERREEIRQAYEDLHHQNDVAVRDALESRNILQYELKLFAPEIEELAPLTFAAYLSQSLASRGMIAALIAFLLIFTQLVSSVSATASLIMASKPPEKIVVVQTLTPSASDPASASITPSPTGTMSPIVTPSTIPNTPVDTLTPVVQLVAQPTLPGAIAACVPTNTFRETALVVGIVDGDTIDAQIGDEVFRVRYIGIDTPEQDEAFFNEATAYNQNLMLNQTVTLVKDQSETDQFGRLLRYVVLGDTFVNHELVKAGFASASAYTPDVACATVFERAQVQAQTESRGLWIPTTAPYLAPVTGDETARNCDPSYPGVCIPSAPPDLDCGDVSFERFTVIPPDPHGFDRDQDGVGCEN